MASRKNHKRFMIMRRRMQTTYKALSVDQLKTGDTCPICWESYDKTCRILPCSHIFHVHCIQQWFEQESTCPTCRYNLHLESHTQQPQPQQQPPPPTTPPATTTTTQTSTPTTTSTTEPSPPTITPTDITSTNNTDTQQHHQQATTTTPNTATEDESLTTTATTATTTASESDSSSDNTHGLPLDQDTTQISGRLFGMQFGIRYRFGNTSHRPRPRVVRRTDRQPTETINNRSTSSTRVDRNVTPGADTVQNFVNVFMGNDDDIDDVHSINQVTTDMVNQVLQVLPDRTETEVSQALHRNNGNVENTINQLLD